MELIIKVIHFASGLIAIIGYLMWMEGIKISLKRLEEKVDFITSVIIRKGNKGE